MNLHHNSLRIHVVNMLAVALVLSACSSGPSGAPAAPPTDAPPPAASPQALSTIKVATYNILAGAGRDPAADQYLDAKFKGDRVPRLIEYLRQLDADIIGLQETTAWDEGTPPYIETVAAQLGMNYVVSTGRSDASLLTKYPIQKSADLSNEVNSIVMARLQAPSGQPVNVFVAHLNSDSVEDRACGTQFLLLQMQPYANQWTFLMGDMNYPGKDKVEWGPKGLKEGGWQLVDMDNRWGLDQIWVPASLRWDATAWSAAIGDDLATLSDHSPVGVELNIYSPAGELLPGATETPMPGVQGLPPSVSEAIPDAKVAFAQQPGAACNEQHWLPDWSNANINDVDMHLYGEPEWQSYAGWSKRISDHEAFLLDFKYESGSEFNIFLEHGDWGTPEFAKFGIVLGSDSRPYADIYRGGQPAGGDAWEGMGSLKPDTWYRLLLAAGDGGSLTGFVWETDDPAHIGSYTRQMGPEWAGLPWKLVTNGNHGGADFRAVTQLAYQPGP